MTDKDYGKVYRALRGEPSDEELQEAARRDREMFEARERERRAAERPIPLAVYDRALRAVGVEPPDRSTATIHARMKLYGAITERLAPAPAGTASYDRTDPTLRLGVALEHLESVHTMRLLDEVETAVEGEAQRGAGERSTTKARERSLDELRNDPALPESARTLIETARAAQAARARGTR